MNLGFGELLLIFIVVLLVFGSSKLPQLGDALGRGIKNFKRTINEPDSIDVTPAKDATATPPPVQAPGVQVPPPAATAVPKK
jgi:sec-independent protein translocase protein TatA